MGFQADQKDSSQTEQKEDDGQQEDDEKDTAEEDDTADDDTAKQDLKPNFLKIGREAPALDIDYWPTDNNGLLPPVKKFESGKIYVLNFFQIDNPYSVDTLKTMVKLQSKYSDKPVQVVCISVSDRDETDEFLDKDVDDKDEDSETYIDLLNPISTAVDSKRTAEISYLAQAGIRGASTFIVGPTGKVEWLGRPTDLKKPLAQIVKGEWDRKAFAKEVEPKQILLLRQIKLDQQFAEWIIEVTKGKKISGPMLLEEFAKGAKDPANKAFRVRIETRRMSLMLLALEAEAKLDDLEADLPEIMRSVTKLSQDDSNSELNDSAWKVYEIYEAGLIDKDSELMDAAQEMAEKALKFSPKSGAVNDTVAHFVYLLDGDLDRAIKLQEFAIENSADTQLEELEDFLKFLKKEKATGERKSLQKQAEDQEDENESDF